MIGVDAPETRRTSKKEIGFFANESKEYLTQLIDNNCIRFEYDVNLTDRYGRTLAYVFLEDGTFVNAELIKYGYAVVMTVPPNVKYADYFIKLQENARLHKLGLWNIPIH